MYITSSLKNTLSLFGSKLISRFFDLTRKIKQKMNLREPTLAISKFSAILLFIV